LGKRRDTFRSARRACYRLHVLRAAPAIDTPQISERDRRMLEELQRGTFDYFTRFVSTTTGLVADRTQPGSPASIAATGLGLSVWLVGAERGYCSRIEAARLTLTLLRFLDAAEQSDAAEASGYKGFFYHFLDMDSGRRAGRCELSTIDTALLMAGVLTSACYFTGADADEVELRALAELIYRRVEWSWASNKNGTVGHGWTPEHGKLRWTWNRGYSEASLLYVLALGSPSFPIAATGYEHWTRTFERITAYGIDYLYAGPLFLHQLPQVWLEFRGIRDAQSRNADWDYFENSRRATLIHRAYAIDNPHGFAAYSENCWGLTASLGPGPQSRTIDGKRRRFFGYKARGAPFGPDDGTVSPWAVVASLPFAAEVVLPAMHHAIERLALRCQDQPGLESSFNATFREKDRNPNGWVAPWKFGLDEGPIVLMIENHLTGFVWRMLRGSQPIVSGLRRAGFSGGWLDDALP